MDRRTNAGEPSAYRSYLLRLWRAGEAGGPWRASLQSAVAGERLGFASLDDLFDFIRRQINLAPDLHPDASEEETHERR